MNFRAEFDLDPKLIYLNSGSVSICPRSVNRVAQKAREEFELNPTLHLFESKARMWHVQQKVGEYFHARPQDVFLRCNITLAINNFVLGYRPLPKGEILVNDLEYGAVVNVMKWRAQKEGHEFRTFKLPSEPKDLEGLTSAQLVERVVRELKPETRMLLISEVTTSNGLVMPIKEIAAETRSRGILLIVDSAHGPGAVPIDFREFEDVDFWGGNLHKWMMAPKGTAFGWIPERHHDSVDPHPIGWTTYETGEVFKDFGDGSRFASRMFDTGTYDFGGYFAIPETLQFWNRLGESTIFNHRRALRSHLVKCMKDLKGFSLASSVLPELEGPLVTYRLPEKLKTEGYGLMKRLLVDHQLQVVTNLVRGEWHLRLTPALHNTIDEIDRAVEILSGL